MASAKEDEEEGAPDWAEAYAALLCHTSMHYEEIGDRTIPQVEAIMNKLGKHIGLKIGVPWDVDEGKAAQSQLSSKERPPKLSELVAFCNNFAGTE